MHNAGLSLQLNTITSAVPFLRIAPDARSAGMGDAGIAISPNANSFFWNTSRLVFSEKRMGFSSSYSPWMRSLTDDVHLVGASGYTKLGDRHAIGGAFRYFVLGNVSFFDPQGNLIREFNPTEFDATVGYSYKLSERSAIGLNAKFVYSNLTGGVTTGTVEVRPGTALAVDVSYSYVNPDVQIARKDATWSLGVNIANLGNKVAYSTEAERDFLPANLGLGTALKVEIDKRNSLTSTININKLLVPTAPVRNGSGQIVSGWDNNVGVLLGIVQSFYDAPGNVFQHPNGNVQIQKGSRLREELNEITLGGGVEYWYNNMFALRTGYFYQHRAKGDQKYFTFGAGIRYNIIGFDVSCLAALKRTNPLANTLRFSLLVDLPSKG